MILRPQLYIPQQKKIIIRLRQDEEMRYIRLLRRDWARRGADPDEMFSMWAPPTGTGKSAGTPVDWAALKAGAPGTTRTVTNTTQLNTAMGVAVPGDVVILSGAGGPWDGDWNLSASGVAGNPIIIVAAVPGTWGSRTIVKAAGKITVSGAYITLGGFRYTGASAANPSFVLQGRNTILTDTEIANFVFTSSQYTLLKIREIAHSAHLHHNYFDNNNAFDIQYAATETAFATGVIIEYNDFRDANNKWVQIATLPNPYQQNHSLLNTGVVVRYNNVINCESHEVKSSGNTFYRNYIEGSSSSGMAFRAGELNVFEGNYFKSCTAAVLVSGGPTAQVNSIINNVFDACAEGVRLKEGSLQSQMDPATASYIYNAQHVRAENTLIAHNVFLNSTSYDIRFGAPQTGRNGSTEPQPYSPIDTTIIDNIFTGSAGVRIFTRNPNSVIDTTPAKGAVYPTAVDSYHKYINTHIKNNDFYLSAAPPTAVIGDDTTDGGTPTGYINWTHASLTSGTVVSGNIETNPNLSSVYRITGAPCQNAGLAYNIGGMNSATLLDWEGNSRTTGAATDMGVIEVGSSTPPATGTYALFGAGFTTVNVAVTDRYTYADNTVSAGTALSTSRRALAAAGNTTVGVFCGGYVAANVATTERYTYVGDAVSAGTALSTARRVLAAAGNATIGVFGGGFVAVQVATMDKYTYATDAFIAATSLGTIRDSLAATGDSFIGLFGGGYNGTAQIAVVDKYNYAENSMSSGTALIVGREDFAAASDATRAVFGGGLTSVVTAVTDRYVYATDAVTAGTALATAREDIAAAGSTTTGYFGGGLTTVAVAVLDKVVFDTDVVSAGTALGTARSALAATSGIVVGAPPAPAPPPPITTGVYAIFGGGFTTVNVAVTDRYIYSTDVVSAGTALGTARRELAAVGSATKSVFSCGLTGVVVNVTDLYTYAGDVVSAGTALAFSTRSLAVAGNATRGVFGGGFTSSNMSVTFIYTYATDASVSSTHLSLARESLSATGTLSNGVFAGGLTTVHVATTDLYTYSTEAVTDSTLLSTARHSLAASGNSVVGIFGGGQVSGGTTSAVTDRYIHATDEVLSGTALTTAKEDLAAAGNDTTGYFGGGFTSVVVATLNKYVYAVNTVSAGTALGTARHALAATGALVLAPVPTVTTTFGVFAGGHVSGVALAITDRYVYASDAVISGTALTLARYFLAALSSATEGIFCGGTTATTRLSTTETYTFANNTVTPSTALLTTRSHAAGVSTTASGILSSGAVGTGTITATTDKFNFTTKAVTSGTALNTARYGVSAAGNSVTGIFSGGRLPVVVTVVATIDRYVHATESMTPGTELYFYRQRGCAQGDAHVGAFAGGATGSALIVKYLERYIFASDAVSPGANLNINRDSGAAVGDSATGIFSGGLSVSFAATASTDRYTFAADTMGSGAELTIARSTLAGASGTVLGAVVRYALALQKHRGLCAATFGGLVLVGDYLSGMVYHQDATYYYDDAGSASTPVLILKRRVTPIIQDENFWLFYDRLMIEMEAGAITDPLDFELTWSDNGGVSRNTNVSPRNIVLLNPNSALGRVLFNRLGKARWRSWQLDISAPIRLVITGASANIRKGRA